MKERNRQPKEKLFEEGGSLFLAMEIEGEVVAQMISWLAEKENDPEILEMKVFINSEGGDLWECLTIAEAIRKLSKPVTTVVTGRAFSGACLIAAAGTKERVAWRNSRFMLHEITIGEIEAGTLADLRDEVKEAEEENNILLNAISSFTGQPIEKLREDLTGKLKYMTPQEALDYGIIDRVES